MTRLTFPKTLYARWEDAGKNEDPFLLADSTPEGENGQLIGVYKLVEIKTKKITQALV